MTVTRDFGELRKGSYVVVAAAKLDVEDAYMGDVSGKIPLLHSYARDGTVDCRGKAIQFAAWDDECEGARSFLGHDQTHGGSWTNGARMLFKGTEVFDRKNAPPHPMKQQSNRVPVRVL